MPRWNADDERSTVGLVTGRILRTPANIRPYELCFIPAEEMDRSVHSLGLKAISAGYPILFQPTPTNAAGVQARVTIYCENDSDFAEAQRLLNLG